MDKIDMWGPKNPLEKKEKEKKDNVSNLITEDKKLSKLERNSQRRSWGLIDVVLGFLLFLAFQVVLTLGFFAYVAVGEVASGNNVTDPELLTQRLLEVATSGPGIAISAFSMYLSWMITLSYATLAHGLRSFAKDFAFRFQWKRDIIFGLLIAVGLRALEQGVSALLLLFGVDLSKTGNTGTITDLSGFWFILAGFFIASIAAPVFEELFFRGFVLRAALKNFEGGKEVKPQTFFGDIIKNKLSFVFKIYTGFRHELYRHRYIYAVLLSSALFGAMHVQSLEGGIGTWAIIIQTGTIGAVLAFITLKTQRLGMNIFAHVFFNLLGVILVTVLS